jgi:penicillin G amidase
VADLIAAYEDFHAPMQNVVMADTSGRVAFKATGRVPLRHPDNDIMGVAPRRAGTPATTGKAGCPTPTRLQVDHDTISAAGWLATANQRIHSADYPHFITQDWEIPVSQGPHRHLAGGARAGTTLDSQATIQADVVSESARVLLPHLLGAPVSHPLGDCCARPRWPRSTVNCAPTAPVRSSSPCGPTSSPVASSAGRLGEERLMAMYGRRVFRPAIEGILARNDTDWCGAAGCAMAAGQALERCAGPHRHMAGQPCVRLELGQAHPALSAHKPFSNVGPLAKVFDVPALEGDHMVDLGSDADPLADRVVVVRGHVGHDRLAAGQAQGVEELRAAKGLAHDLRLHRGVVVVHDVVGAQQHIAQPGVVGAGQRAFLHVLQGAQRGLHRDLAAVCRICAG